MLTWYLIVIVTYLKAYIENIFYFCKFLVFDL